MSNNKNNNNSSNLSSSVLAGLTAGVVTRTIVCPLDVIKLRLQVPEGRHFRLLHEARRLPWWTLWRGNTAGILLYAGYSGVQFGTYAALGASGDDRSQGSGSGSAVVVFGRAATAALAATALTYPFDVLRTRMALSRQAGSIFKQAAAILRTEGPTAFYKGALLTLAQVVPYMGSVFMLHSCFLAVTNDFLAGALSGFICKTVSLPVDVLRKRVQMLRLSEQAFTVEKLSPAENAWELARRMWRVEGGLRPFFRGWTMAVSKAAATTGITFLVYDRLLALLTGTGKQSC